ncbi:MAG: DUF1109 family protein, partial [Gammaproteobacteria bacterium]|nr:DUF1109 family protein [Gammaproteobacteria bacterium]
AETAVAALAVGVLALAAFLSAVPGAAKPWRTVSWSTLAVGAWLGFYVAGLAGYPAHPVSELGHRQHCFLESQLIALPNAALLLWLTARLMPLRPVLTGALAGCAGAAAPAALMQLACMYSPDHILIYHATPVAITGLSGALVAPLLLRRRNLMPPRRTQTLH